MNTSRVLGSLAGILSLLGACATEPLAARGSHGQTINLAVGQELDVTLQTIAR